MHACLRLSSTRCRARAHLVPWPGWRNRRWWWCRDGAARVPVSKSSDEYDPPNGMSRWVCASIPRARAGGRWHRRLYPRRSRNAARISLMVAPSISRSLLCWRRRLLRSVLNKRLHDGIFLISCPVSCAGVDARTTAGLETGAPSLRSSVLAGCALGSLLPSLRATSLSTRTIVMHSSPGTRRNTNCSPRTRSRLHAECA